MVLIAFVDEWEENICSVPTAVRFWFAFCFPDFELIRTVVILLADLI